MIEEGDMVFCCITGNKVIATKDIADEVRGGDPDWEIICKKDDPKLEAMKVHLTKFN